MFGVKKSLVVVRLRAIAHTVQSLTHLHVQKLDIVKSEAEARAKGFKTGDTFKCVHFDFVLATEAESQAARAQYSKQVGATF